MTNDVGYPPDLPLTIDPTVRICRARNTITGGEPFSLLRLSPSGMAAFERLAFATRPNALDHAAQRLARMLVDRGILHPRPDPDTTAIARTTVVIPARGRTDHLERCLAAASGAPTVVVDDGSPDPDAIASACARHGARCIHRPAPGGPAAARNTGLTGVDTEFVAFLDSDCVAPARWLHMLSGHFADPRVAAVAPRVRGKAPDWTALGRFAAARSPLDLGPRAARVVPGGRVSYVPAAALLARTKAVRAVGFDENLRYGEDVDLVWRLHDIGWTIRYDPTVQVRHAEPTRPVVLAARRFRYGTSAGPLAVRHPGRLAPLRLRPSQMPALAALVLGHPMVAAMVAGATAAGVTGQLYRAGVPLVDAAAIAVRVHGRSVQATGRAMTALAAPAFAAALCGPRSRGAAMILVTSAPLSEWMARRPRLDPLRWALLCTADEIAYGAGVWAGAIGARRPELLLPAIEVRSAHLRPQVSD